MPAPDLARTRTEIRVLRECASEVYETCSCSRTFAIVSKLRDRADRLEATLVVAERIAVPRENESNEMRPEAVAAAPSLR